MSAGPFHLTGLSGNELYCLHLKQLRAQGLFVGNSVQSLGLMRGMRAAFSGIVGGEVADVTRIIHEGRAAAFDRLVNEAKSEGVSGLVGVSSDLRSLAGNTEFLFMGSGVQAVGSAPFFSSAGGAQELYCHMDAGYAPLAHAFGNIAYSVGVAGGLLGNLKTLVRGEIREFSDVFNTTRHQALERLIGQAHDAGANAVVGIRTHVLRFAGVHEMYMVGTASHHPSLPQTTTAPIVTSDLTGEELWGLTRMGYAPLKLLISTSVYSLGAIGGFVAAMRGLSKGEIPELTQLVYDAREEVFSRLNREAQSIGADSVVGIKTYVVELGSGLIEIFAVGTAIRKVEGITTATDTLPPQAIIRDRDTWIEGDLSFDASSLRAGEA
jgi:uncharacterized protein YbjQ (UPF0145 family)